MRLFLAAAALLAAGSPLAAQQDSTWRDHARAAEAARAAADWPGYQHHLRRADDEVGAHPAIVVGLARAAARLGDHAGAFAQLDRFAAMGLSREIGADAELASLRGTPEWAAVTARLAANGLPLGSARTVFTLPDSGMVPEDLAYDGARHRWLVSSVRRGSVVAVDARGTVSPFASGPWAMQGMALDSARERLWVVSSALTQGPALAPGDSGRAAILRYHLPGGRLEHRYDFRRGGPHAPGDLTVAANGDVYAGDSRTGAVYRIAAGADSIATLVPGGILRSAQQPAVAPGGEELLVADYTRGIAVVTLRTGAVRWLRPAPRVALTGIDGLLVHGSHLFAVQNGVAPHRLLRLRVDGALTRVEGYEVLLQDPAWVIEPTHAAVSGGMLHLIANSGWDALADDGTVRPGARLLPGRVVAVPLP